MVFRGIAAFNPAPKGGYLAFLGRISPEKRPDRAIEIANRAGAKLKIAAKIDKVDQEYWKNVIEPMVASSPNVEYIGEIGERDKAEFLGNADALLFPIDWPEPFGLVMIEAMSCGTPVIAFRRGSAAEVIDDGVSGISSKMWTKPSPRFGAFPNSTAPGCERLLCAASISRASQGNTSRSIRHS